MNWYETAFGRQYSHLYAHRDRAEADRAIAGIVRGLDIPSGPVLDLGCGAGRHLGPLASIGMRGVGLDLSPYLLREAARDRDDFVPAFSLVRGDMRTLPFAEGAFGAVFSLFTAFGYFGDLPAHAPLLAELARVLKPGGLWLLDYLNCRRVRDELAGGGKSAVREAGAVSIRETRRLADGGGRVLKTVEMTSRRGHEGEAAALGISREGLRYEESVALFEPEDLDALAAAAGLVRDGGYGDYDGGPPDETNAARWIIIYRRRDG